jgi:hypothetical protein
MDIAGGAMDGYCATGSENTDMTPTIIMMIASTHANTGLPMKNPDTASSQPSRTTPKWIKVFCFCSSEKKILLF